jgi:hypothetical protein
VPFLHLITNRSSESSFESSKFAGVTRKNVPDLVPCPGPMKKVVWGELELSRLLMALPNQDIAWTAYDSRRPDDRLEDPTLAPYTCFSV